jgi:broad specificity phosphatase PhoE
MLLAVPALLTLLTAPSAEAADAVLYVVRHAEKASDPKGDPALTPAGQVRAEALAHALAEVPLAGVHSTDTTRTRATAAPLAGARGLAVQTYDPSDAGALVTRLRAAGGGHLVVGHSDTIAGIVAAAGGDGGPTVGDHEFDRLYVVVLPEEGAATTVRLRYGAPTPPPR